MRQKEIKGAEIDKIVKFIELKKYELMNLGHHPDDLSLLIPYWLYNAIQKYYNSFFNGELPETFFGLKPSFHYKDEVVIYNWFSPEKNFFSRDIITEVIEEEQPTCKPIK